MKIKKIIFVIASIITIAFIAGCGDVTKHYYIFTGETEHWKGELEADTFESFYEVDGSLCYDSRETIKYSATYKGELSDLASVKNTEVSYETPSGEGSVSDAYGGPPETKTIKSGKSSSSGGAVISKDDVITITVTVDGQAETMQLKETHDLHSKEPLYLFKKQLFR